MFLSNFFFLGSLFFSGLTSRCYACNGSFAYVLSSTPLLLKLSDPWLLLFMLLFCFICLFFPLIIFSLFVFPFYLFLLDLMCLLFNISILIVLLSMLCFQWETKYKKLLQVTLLGDGFVASTLVSCLLNSLLSFVSPLGCIIALPTCPIPFLFRLTDLLLSFLSPGLLVRTTTKCLGCI